MCEKFTPRPIAQQIDSNFAKMLHKCVCVTPLAVCLPMIKIIRQWKRNEKALCDACETGECVSVRIYMYEKGRHFHTHKESVGDTSIPKQKKNERAFFSVCTVRVQIQEPCSCLAMRLHFDGYIFRLFLCDALISYISRPMMSGVNVWVEMKA